VEHSEGKGGESVVAILRFLCGSPHPSRLRTVLFGPRWQVMSCVLTTCQVFMGPGVKDVVGGGMRLRAKISPVDRGPISTE
jgi:hypothetical protein